MNKSVTIMALSALAVATSANGQLTYPKAPQEPVVDNYFGIDVADPFRPLENDTAAQTLQWVEAERLLTDEYFQHIPFRENIRHRIASFQDYVKAGVPHRGNDGRYYFYENSGLKNQAILYRSNSLGGDREVFIDPNTLSADGTVALTGTTQSPDGKYTAYTISRNGSDWTEIYVLDTETGQLLDDRILWAKFTEAVWYGDGFFYSAYGRPQEGGELSDANEYQRVYYHRLGSPQSADHVIYEDLDNPLYFHEAEVPHGSDYLFIIISGQGSGQAVKLQSLVDSDGEWKVMSANQDDRINIIGLRGDSIYFTTNYHAPRGRLMMVDANNPSKENWVELIAQTDAVLTDVAFAADHLVATYSKDASDHLYVCDLDGRCLDEVKLPTPGTVTVSCNPDHDELLYSLTSFLYPWAHFSYDFAARRSLLLREAHLGNFDPDDYVTEEYFYPSADGTKVHLFMTRRKDIVPDGTNPLYLYGYGGFNIGLTPGFSPNRLLWLENGGIFVVANIRGGNEYGEGWHVAGTKLNKINVFDDFIAAAEYLIGEGWTSPERLVIEGGSNGGLLVAACVQMRPDLFKVAVPRVGVMDMMRYHLFTIGWNWAHDYGTSADSPEMARYLLSYSPIHNIANDGTPYPAILVTTADHDDRVVPAHSFKYAATLQASDTGDAPKIIRIDSNAGHGGGKPISKIIDEQTDIYSFIYYNLGLEPTTVK
jgi:prolyl oligopeptidase